MNQVIEALSTALLCSTSIFAIGKLIGFSDIYRTYKAFRQIKTETKNLFTINIKTGDKKDIKQFMIEYRAHLDLNSINLLICKIDELERAEAEHKRQTAEKMALN